MEKSKGKVIEERVYIGSKMVRAIPMDKSTFLKENRGLTSTKGLETTPGYQVTYRDGYISWCPKDEFESVYREVTGDEKKLIGE